jgi:hypothetical protein
VSVRLNALNGDQVNLKAELKRYIDYPAGGIGERHLSGRAEHLAQAAESSSGP